MDPNELRRHEKSWNDPPLFTMDQLNHAPTTNKRHRYPQMPQYPAQTAYPQQQSQYFPGQNAMQYGQQPTTQYGSTPSQPFSGPPGPGFNAPTQPLSSGFPPQSMSSYPSQQPSSYSSSLAQAPPIPGGQQQFSTLSQVQLSTPSCAPPSSLSYSSTVPHSGVSQFSTPQAQMSYQPQPLSGNYPAASHQMPQPGGYQPF